MLRDERGGMAVLAAAVLVVLLGCAALAADIGQLVLSRSRAASAADAAALAGAQELCVGPEAAFDVALAYGQANGAAPEEMNIEVTGSVAVDITRTVRFVFAPVLGVDSGTVRAHARAVAAPVTGVGGAAPLAMPDQEYTYGELYDMKVSQWQDGYLGPGQFGALCLGNGSGADWYYENLKKGYAGVLRVGDVVPTENGNMSGKTGEGIAYRFALCDGGCTFDNFDRDCPRVLTVPIVEPAGHKSVRVLGFAAFWVEEIPGSGNKSIIRGRFVRKVTTGTVDPGAQDYGLYGVRLVE